MVKKKGQGRRKHVPMRRCIACHQSLPKRSLIRLVSVPEHGVVIDPSSKMAGRGAYLCNDPACWEKVIASEDILSRALNTKVSSDARATLLACWERELRVEPGRVAEG